jgi:hypothetical protein
MKKDELIRIIRLSLRRVYRKDEILFRIGVDERALNHRLAFYLAKLVERNNVKVDVEYNRHLVGMKYYEDNRYGSLDILIHERGTDTNNICAFECKKDKISKTDITKIRALLGAEYQYTFGVTIEYVSREIKLYFKQGRKIIEEKIEL